MENNTIVIEDARLMYTNFSGNEAQYNPKGNRNFCVIIPDPEIALKLKQDGWNVRPSTPRDPDDEPFYFLKVKINYNFSRPPKIVMVTERGNMTILGEDTINLLDSADIVKADLEINPSYYKKNDGSRGISAYLKTLYVTIAEDRFAEKYAQEESPIEF